MQSLKEYKNYIIILIVLGLGTIFYFKNALFLTILALYTLIAYLNRRKIEKSIYLFIFLYVFHCFMLLLLYRDFFAANADGIFRFFLSFIASTLLMIIPFIMIFRMENIILDVFRPKEKVHAKLICTQHLTRTEPLFLDDGEIRIACRIDTSCSRNKKLKYADKLIGVVGKNIRKSRVGRDYYVNLLGQSRQEIRNGDYDFIEIYQSGSIKDYNSVLSQIMAFFYNDLNGYRPMNEIVVKIFGELNLSNNTQRLLEKNFKDVKYYKLR